MYVGASSCATTNIFGKKYNEAVCREAWNNLKKGKNPAFDYINPQKRLPKVFIYGDSISIGYTPTVRKQLEGKADVFRIHRNGFASHSLQPFMETMRKAMFQPDLEQGWGFDWDVIHFNVGLHDLKYVKEGKLDKVNGNQVSSLDQYRTRFTDACEYLISIYPKAQIIFATTTAVPEGDVKGRFAGDSARYNQVAIEVLANYPSIVINDLYGFTKPHADEWHIKPGDVHYNEIGKAAQGKEVASVIEKYL